MGSVPGSPVVTGLWSYCRLLCGVGLWTLRRSVNPGPGGLNARDTPWIRKGCAARPRDALPSFLNVTDALAPR